MSRQSIVSLMARTWPVLFNSLKRKPPACLRVRGNGSVAPNQKLYKVLTPATWHDQGTYRYVPLSAERNWIRLLELLPGTSSIKCNLFYADLDDPPNVPTDDGGSMRYHALSYTWGSQSRDHKIVVDEQELAVTKNLHDLLMMLRKPASIARLLWVDAICINQEDPVEKRHQISLMGRIYSTATEVVAWFGTEDKHVGPAFDLIRQIATIDPVQVRSRDFYVDEESLRGIGLPAPLDPEWAHFVQFFNNPYFERAWIVQELTQSKSPVLLSGSHTLDWETFARAHMIMNLILRPLENFLAVMYQDHTFHRQQRCVGHVVIAREVLLEQKPQPFGVNVTLFRKFKATDARDKVFAFASMATDLNQAEFSTIVDYSKSVEQSYVDATRFLILQRHGLAMLSEVEDFTMRKLHRLPSWVPDYSVEAGFAPYGGIELNCLYDFHASAETPIYVQCLPDTGILQVKGRRIDVVDIIAPTLFDDVSGRTNPIYEWMMFIDSNEQIDWLSSDIWNVFIAETGSPAGMQMLGRVHPAPAEYQRHFHAILAVHAIEVETEGPVTVQQLRSIKEKTGGDAGHFLSTFMIAGGFRALFRTNDRRWGLGPMSSQKNEVVWLLSGATVPYILRPEEGSFRLVGEAYVAGIMDGEMAGDTNDWKIINLV